ncbi:hypothetical protein CAEBREN_15613 [Caenorhabditis brenneri]|uniref:Uncharacterized protein n=1 Tax=Caenorhabditis brenneri TaxID=135651 RepID=G0ND59_CAEBE|nr:hypothetical protein CAEBREN_15613 [Caenorhabditis brenneri]
MAPTTRSKSKMLQTGSQTSEPPESPIPAEKTTSATKSSSSKKDHSGSTENAARVARFNIHTAQKSEKAKFSDFVMKKCLKATEPLCYEHLVQKFTEATGTRTSENVLKNWVKAQSKSFKSPAGKDEQFIRQIFALRAPINPTLLERINAMGSAQTAKKNRKRILVKFESKDRKLRVGDDKKRQNRKKKDVSDDEEEVKHNDNDKEEKQEEEDDEEGDEEEEDDDEEEDEVEEGKDEEEDEAEEENDEEEDELEEEKEDEQKKEEEKEQKEEEEDEDEDEEEEKIEEEEELEKEEDELEVEKDGFKDLPDEADRLIERAWNKTLAPNEKFVEAFSIEIYRKDLLTLSGLHWLNDNIINYYLQLICDRSVQNREYPKTYAFNTFFYTNIIEKGYTSVKRWTKKVDLFSYEIILVPVHLGMHWCMAVIDMVAQKIEFYDSLYDDNTDVLPALKMYIAEESLDKKQVQFDFTGWKIYQMEDGPRQTNGSDCGVFSCQFGEWASRRQSPCFTQQNMPYFRERMTYEIVEQKLLAPPPLTPLRPISHEDAKDVPSCSGESTPAGALSPRSDTREVTNAYDEMIATEISYVADLKQVIIHYLEPFEAVENQNSLPEALRGKPDCLFGNIRELYKFHHRVVLEDLVAARSTAEMCRVLMQHRNQIYITYHTYCQIHGSNQKERDSVKNHPFFKDCQRKANHNMDISSYLLKPIQRIMKYQLLLGNIMDDCPTDVRDEVAMTRNSMVELLNQIDASMQQLHISGYNGDLKSLGLLRLQTECDVYTYNRKKEAKLSRAQKRILFFFDRVVMFCKKRVSNPGTGLNSEPEYFEHKFCIPIISLGHEATSRTGAGRFEVWDEDKTDAYVIETIDPSARTKWIQRLGKSDTSQNILLNEE